MSRLEEIIQEEIKKIDFSKHVMGNEPIEDDEFEDMESIMLAFRYARLSLPFILKFNNTIRERYAREVAQASLEKASELPQNLYDDEWHLEKLKESITNPDNILIRGILSKNRR